MERFMSGASRNVGRTGHFDEQSNPVALPAEPVPKPRQKGMTYEKLRELRRSRPLMCRTKINPEELPKSPSELRRDRKWQLIEPLVPAPAGTGKRPPDLTCLDALVRDRAQAVNVSAGQVFDALHRYYAFGGMKNALFPNPFIKSGAPGVPRRGKNNVKLGRKNALVKAGDIEKAGLVLTNTDVLNIQDAYVTFVRPGTTITQAFLSMSAMYYSKSHEMKHG